MNTNSYKAVIAIDFDGTIVEHKFPDIGKLLPNAKKAISALYHFGFYIIIYTCRGGVEVVEMIKFLDFKKVPYHKINENAPFEMIKFKPSPKIYADVYIDDHNIFHNPSWKEIYEEVVRKYK